MTDTILREYKLISLLTGECKCLGDFTMRQVEQINQERAKEGSMYRWMLAEKAND